jgi:hypothetical protein
LCWERSNHLPSGLASPFALGPGDPPGSPFVPLGHALEHDLGLAHRPRRPSAAAHLVVAQRPPELGQVSHPLPAAVTSVTTVPGRRPEAPTSAIVSSAVHFGCKLEKFEKVSEGGLEHATSEISPDRGFSPLDGTPTLPTEAETSAPSRVPDDCSPTRTLGGIVTHRDSGPGRIRARSAVRRGFRVRWLCRSALYRSR